MQGCVRCDVTQGWDDGVMGARQQVKGQHAVLLSWRTGARKTRVIVIMKSNSTPVHLLSVQHWTSSSLVTTGIQCRHQPCNMWLPSCSGPGLELSASHDVVYLASCERQRKPGLRLRHDCGLTASGAAPLLQCALLLKLVVLKFSGCYEAVLLSSVS